MEKELKEIATLLNAVIAKIEKLQFEVNDWVEIESGGNGALGSNGLVGQVIKYDKSIQTTGGIEKGKYPLIRCINRVNWQLCNGFKLRKLTLTEVQEALTKEAVKLYTGVKSIKNITTGSVNKFTNQVSFIYDNKDNTAFYYGCKVFDNGIWATPIKTKTIEEIANEFDEFHYHGSDRTGALSSNFLKFCIKNKQTIIKTLNNL